jgi:hypothetical protein
LYIWSPFLLHTAHSSALVCRPIIFNTAQQKRCQMCQSATGETLQRTVHFFLRTADIRESLRRLHYTQDLPVSKQ